MVFIDGIVFSLQRSGGISVYFSELVSRLLCDKSVEARADSYSYNDVTREYMLDDLLVKTETNFPFFLERNRRCRLPLGVTVFHSSYYRMPSKRNFNGRVVTTVHDFTSELYNSGLKQWLGFKQKKRAILNSDIVVCISKNTQADLYKFIPEARNMDVRVVYNGTSDDFIVENDTLCVFQKYVVFIGQRGGYKNFFDAVKSLEFHSDLTLRIIGGGSLTESELQLLDNVLPSRYEYLGFVSNAELNKIYNRAFCLLYPSSYEGFGQPPIEAMKSGCPVIAIDSSSISELCSGYAILAKKSCAFELSKAITSLKVIESRLEFTQKASQYAMNFTWEKTFLEYKEIYLELA